MKNKTIFKVDVLNLNLNQKETEKRFIRDRTWGYFFNFEDAQQSILENHTDMFENGYYNFGLISEIPQGICVSPSKISQHWYIAKYQKDTDKPTISLFHKSKDIKSKAKDPLNLGIDKRIGVSCYIWGY